MTIVKTDFGYQKVLEGTASPALVLYISPGQTAEVICAPEHQVDVVAVAADLQVTVKSLGIDVTLSELEALNLSAGSRELEIKLTCSTSVTTTMVIFNPNDKEEVLVDPKVNVATNTQDVKPVSKPTRRRRGSSKAAEQQLRAARAKGLDVARPAPPPVQPNSAGINQRPRFESRNGVIIE